MVSKIVISRVNVIANIAVKNVLEVHEFCNWTDAFFYLEKQFKEEFSPKAKQAFQQFPLVVTNSQKEMIHSSDGDFDTSFYADVCYTVEVSP